MRTKSVASPALLAFCVSIGIGISIGTGVGVGVAQAQPEIRGVQLGVHGGFTSWDLGDIEVADFEKETGPTFGASFGWGMSDFLGLFTRVDRTTISPEDLDSYGVTHWDIGVRAIPKLLGPTIRPFAEVSAAFRFLNLTESNGFKISVAGAGFGVGAGLYAFVTSQFAVSAGINGSFGNLEEVTFGGIALDTNTKATSFRAILGVTWFP